MDLKTKQQKITQTKKLLQKNNVLFFFKGINLNFKNWILIKQQFQALNFTNTRVFNKICQKAINNSIFKFYKMLLNALLFLIYSLKINFLKKKLINFANLFSFNMLALKLNNKIYTKTQIAKNFSLNYWNYKLFLFQSIIIILKNCF